MEERRKQPRNRISRRAYLCDSKGQFYYQCFIRDASKSGCRIYAPDVLDFPALVWVFPEGFEKPIAGTIAWRRRHMAGIDFAAGHGRSAGPPPVLAGGSGVPMFKQIEARIAERAALDRKPSRPSEAGAPDRAAAAPTTYFTNIVHQLKTPLASVTGALAAIVEKAIGVLPQRVRELLKVIDRNAARAEHLVDNYLDSERLEHGKIELRRMRADLNVVVRTTIDAEMQFLDMFDVSCRLEAPDDPAFVNIDAERIQQVMSNLITNAAKYSMPGAEVVVRIERRGGAVRVSVIDNGIGISQEDQSRIFERFYQGGAKPDGASGGAGLGLSICKSILDRHGSTIEVRSEPGVGSTFYFELPEIAAAEKQADQAA